MYGQVGIPVDQFAESLQGDFGYGFKFDYLRRVGVGPLYLGASFGMLNYGGERWNENWALNENVYDSEYAIENTIHDFEVKARIQPDINSLVMPYLEGFAGLSKMSTRFTITDESQIYDCDVETLYDELLSRDFGYTYGAGFGLLISLCPSETVFMDVGATYRNSSQMEYMNDDFDQVFRSRTDMWLVRVGVSFRAWD